MINLNTVELEKTKPPCTLKLHVPFNNYIQAHLSVNKADAQGVPWFWDR